MNEGLSIFPARAAICAFIARSEPARQTAKTNSEGGPGRIVGAGLVEGDIGRGGRFPNGRPIIKATGICPRPE